MVRRVSFSSDSRWLAVASDRGTTHLYALGDALLGRSASAASHQQRGPFEAVAATGHAGVAMDADEGGDAIVMAAGAAFDPTVVNATDISQVGGGAAAATVPTVVAAHRIWQTDVPSDVRTSCALSIRF